MQVPKGRQCGMCEHVCVARQQAGRPGHGNVVYGTAVEVERGRGVHVAAVCGERIDGQCDSGYDSVSLC